jgi:hypothetical protein
MKAATQTHTRSEAQIVPHEANLSDFRKHGLKALFLPVDIASLVFFRIAFGSILLWEVTRYFRYGYIDSYWVNARHTFTFYPFDFLRPLPGEGMYLLYYFLGLLACCLITGFHYRIASMLFFLGTTYSFLLDQARYLNHQYLVSLIALVMIFVPAHRNYSLDARRVKGLRTDVIPAWSVWLLRFTIGLPYFFGGIAKINPDWLAGEPLRTWLAGDTDFPVIGQYFTEDWMIYLMSYAGLLFDLLIIPCLFIKQTRKWAFIVMILFNLMNAKLFEIGIFPWFMILGTTIFFIPSWPRKLAKAWNPSAPDHAVIVASNWNHTVATPTRRKILVSALAIWVLFHVAMPLRHFTIPGNVHWTEEGHLYAWHMKLRTKRSKASFFAVDKKSKELIPVDSREYLNGIQSRKVPGNPDMLWQFAQIIRQDFAEKGRDVEVHADVQVTLNGRAYQRIVNPELDLCSLKRPVWGHSDWLLPLTTPLSNRLEKDSDGDSE